MSYLIRTLAAVTLLTVASLPLTCCELTGQPAQAQSRPEPVGKSHSAVAELLC